MTWFYFIKVLELVNFSNMFLCVIIRECKLYMKYVECCKTHFFMSTVKQFELSGAFLSRSLMALSLDISFARFSYFHIHLFYFFLNGKDSRHMLCTNITTIAKAVQCHSLEKVMKHVEVINTIELNCWHFFSFLLPLQQKWQCIEWNWYQRW